MVTTIPSDDLSESGQDARERRLGEGLNVAAVDQSASSGWKRAVAVNRRLIEGEPREWGGKVDVVAERIHPGFARGPVCPLKRREIPGRDEWNEIS